MIRSLLVILYLFSLLSCSTTSFTLRNESSLLSKEEILSDPEYPLASAFDAILRGLPNHESFYESSKLNCVKKSSSALCGPFRKLKVLKQLLVQKNAIYTPLATKPLVPLTPTFSKSTILNWTSLRKTQIPNLLKGFLGLTQPELFLIANRSIKENRCPNNTAIATAATLEDYLPDNISYATLAALYVKGGNCSKTNLNDREHFWTRAGIFYFWNKDYKAAAKILSKIDPTDAYSGRATYWLYRSKKELNDSVGVATALNRLAKQHRFSFHNLVASYYENREPIPEYSRTISFANRSVKFKKFNNDIASVEILKRLGFAESAYLIVDWLLTQPAVLEPAVRLYLAQMGDDHAKVVQLPGILMFHPELISKESITLNYPRAFFPLFQNSSGSISPYLLLAIARRESSFYPRAVSPANAQGLLQMNPDTVKALHPDETFNLLDPETNISIASGYLSKVLAEMKGNLPQALAAYNAGEVQVHNWEKRYPTKDVILGIDLIPYRETRDYVANVLSTYYWYRKIYENNSDFKQLFP